MVGEVEGKSGKVSGKMREANAFRRWGLFPGSDVAEMSTERRPLDWAPGLVVVSLTRAVSEE